MKVIAIIPARYASTRFPGKPLALLGGKPIIERVYERVAQVIEDVYVATDDQRIFDAVEEFGGNVVMTSTAQIDVVKHLIRLQNLQMLSLISKVMSHLLLHPNCRPFCNVLMTHLQILLRWCSLLKQMIHLRY